MTSQNGDDHWSPSQEQLTAYVDGELGHGLQGPQLRERIEKWLAGHSDAAAEVNAQRRLLDLWKKTAAEDPGEASWAAAWSRINSPPPRDRKSGWRRRLGWSAALLFLTAAAIVLAVILAAGGRDQGPDSDKVDPFPVAAADDVEILEIAGADVGALVGGRLPVTGELIVAASQEVEILRVNGADTDALVVGELPVHGSIVLAKAGDVTLMSIDPPQDNMNPEVRMGGEETPMIWAPQGRAQASEPGM
jgi:hypothetical protein